MSEKRDLAIVGLLLGLLGGALVLADALTPFSRNQSLTLDFLVAHVVYLILGVAILFGSLLLYRGRYSTGGILNLILGIVVLITGPSQLGGVLALISGVVGLLANEARS